MLYEGMEGRSIINVSRSLKITKVHFFTSESNGYEILITNSSIGNGRLISVIPESVALQQMNIGGEN